METKASHEWFVQHQKHGFTGIKQKILNTKRKISIQLLGKRAILSKDLLSDTFDVSNDFDEDDVVVLTIFYQLKKKGKNYDSDSSDPDEFTKGAHVANQNQSDGWTPKYSVRLQDAGLIAREKNKCLFTFFTKKRNKHQKFAFDTTSQAVLFQGLITLFTDVITTRARIKVKELSPGGQRLRRFKLEVVSASNLRPVNTLTYESDPYCIVNIGEKEVFRSNVAFQTVDPVWTASTVFTISSSDFFFHGLTFEILDWEAVAKRQSLGIAHVSVEDIERSANQFMELDLSPEKFTEKKQGKLVVRCQEMDNDDYKDSNEWFNFASITSWNVSVKRHGLKQIKQKFNLDQKELSFEVRSQRNSASEDILSFIDNHKTNLENISNNCNDVIQDGDEIWIILVNVKTQDDFDTQHAKIIFRIRIRDVTVSKHLGKTIELHYFTERKNEEFIFKTKYEADSFANTLLDLKNSMSRKESIFLNENNLRRSVINHYLLEIVSAFDVKPPNVKKIHPYCVVRLGNEEIHRTEATNDSENPVWVFSTKSHFIFSMPVEKLGHYGLSFAIYDRDTLLGQAHAFPYQILTSHDKELELPLFQNNSTYNKGKMLIRFREQNEYDIGFMREPEKFFHDNLTSKTGLRNPLDHLAPAVNYTSHLKNIKILNEKEKQHNTLSCNNIKTVLDKEDYRTLFRVKPYPDPSRPEETKWMSRNEIKTDSMKPSKSWIEIGSGNLGHLFVEIINCEQLYETKLSKLDKIDPFVTLVYESSAISSEVVQNTASPLFMPWTKRAFMFKMEHKLSNLYVGVYDFQQTAFIENTLVGRLTVDLNSFQPNIEYVLRYKLHQSARTLPRKFSGYITLRISMEFNEWKSFRNSIPSFVQDRFHISSEHMNCFKLIKFAVEGKPDQYVYSQAVLFSYLDEICSYINFLVKLPNLMKPIILWRTSHSIPVGRCFKILLPLHSIILFTASALIVERPSLAPSAVLFVLSSIMLYSLYNERKDARLFNPFSFWNLCRLVITGSTTPVIIDPCDPQSIPPELKPLLDKNDENNDAKVDDMDETHDYPEMKKFVTRFKSSKKSKEALILAMENRGAGRMTTSRDKSISILRFVLEPIQLFLKLLVIEPSRTFLKVLKWEYQSLAFLITISSLFTGILFIFVPWQFLIQWTCRLFVWIFLGPLMKLVDIFVVQNVSDIQKPVRRKINKSREMLLKRYVKYAKIKDFKQILFGHHLFSLPSAREPDRFLDRPLPGSYSNPYPAGKQMSREIDVNLRFYGQNLKVDMIPHSSHENDTYLQTENS